MKKILLLTALIPSAVWSQCTLNQHTITSNTNNVVCQGQAEIGLQSSDGFATYFLVANGTDTVQSWLQGDFMGGPITFDPTIISSSTTFSVKARQQFSSKSLNFNGFDQGVSQPGFVCGNSFTIISWVNIQSVNPLYTPFVEIGNFLSEDIWLGLDGNNVSIWLDAGARLTDPNPLPLNQWIPVAVSYDAVSGNLTLMVNGNIVANTNYNAVFTTAQGIMIGADQWNYFTEGSIDHVAVFNSAMQPNQINDYVYSCVNSSSPNLIALFDFEEGTGNQTQNAATGTMADVLNVDVNSWFDGLWVCGPSCDLDMSNTVTVTVTNLQAEPFSAATPSFCSHGSSTTIFSTTSFPNAQYYLIDDASSTVVDGPIAGGGSITFNSPVLSNTTNFSVHAEWIAPSTGLEVMGKAINPQNDFMFTDFTAETWFKNNTSHSYLTDLGVLIAYDYDQVNDMPLSAVAFNIDMSTGLPYIMTANFTGMIFTPSLSGTTNLLD